MNARQNIELRAAPVNGHEVIVLSAGTGATGGGVYAVGTTVNITAGTPPTGQQFKDWTSSASNVIFANANSAATMFIMPANAVTVTANFEAAVKSTYAVSVSAGMGSTGAGNYEAGATVSITVGTPPTGKRFKNWSGGVSFANASSESTTFTMPANAVTVTAVFEDISTTPTTYAVTVTSAGTGATGGGNYASGATVSINAGTAPSGYVFNQWTGTSGVNFTNANSAATTFTMPSNAVTVTANFVMVTYHVTVSSTGTGATGGGDYTQGMTVSISAGTPPSGQVFDKWTSSSNGVNFANANSASTAFTMPANAVAVTAGFKVAPTYKVTISGGYVVNNSDSYAVGTPISIKAGRSIGGRGFGSWICNSGCQDITIDLTKPEATFTMPAHDIKITVKFADEFTDDRDGTLYKTVTIDGKTWMKWELSYKPTSGNSWCYDGKSQNCTDFGRLYDYKTAAGGYFAFKEEGKPGLRGICPAGWHMPSRWEWGELAKAAGGTGDYGAEGAGGNALKSTSGWGNSGNGTDILGFEARPNGYRTPNGAFNNFGKRVGWWTISGTTYIKNGEEYFDKGYRRYLGNDFDNVDEEAVNPDYGFYVRCVENW